jgi:hypothetical protein
MVANHQPKMFPQERAFFRIVRGMQSTQVDLGGLGNPTHFLYAMDNAAGCKDSVVMLEEMHLQSSDPVMLAKAAETAEIYAKTMIDGNMAGIVFLGAIVRGYYDEHADIDVAFFSGEKTEERVIPHIQHINGFEVHSQVARFDDETRAEWEMAKR